jgi:hypothetical protein
MKPARTVSVSVDRSPEVVYAFVADAFNLPQWAPGLCTGIVADPEAKGGWRITTPDGPAHVRFAPVNDFGIVDHHVTLADGATVVYVPLRVVPNGDGSEVLVTVFRREEMSDRDFEKDVAAVSEDLERLKELLEARPA